MSDEKEMLEEKPRVIRAPRKLKAKKDFVILQNEFHFDIKKGDDLSKIPECFHQNLKTEKVI